MLLNFRLMAFISCLSAKASAIQSLYHDNNENDSENSIMTESIFGNPPRSSKSTLHNSSNEVLDISPPQLNLYPTTFLPSVTSSVSTTSTACSNVSPSLKIHHIKPDAQKVINLMNELQTDIRDLSRRVTMPSTDSKNLDYSRVSSHENGSTDLSKKSPSIEHSSYSTTNEPSNILQHNIIQQATPPPIQIKVIPILGKPVKKCEIKLVKPSEATNFGRFLHRMISRDREYNLVPPPQMDLEPRMMENKMTENKMTENKITKNKIMENKSEEPQENDSPNFWPFFRNRRRYSPVNQDEPIDKTRD